MGKFIPVIIQDNDKDAYMPHIRTMIKPPE